MLRAMTKLMALAMVAALAACGGSKSAPPPADPATAKPATGGTIELAELVFMDGNDAGLKLHADGRLEIQVKHSEGGKPAVAEWKDVATIGADGSVTHDGKVGHINADGTFTMPDGTTAPYKFDGDALVVADKKLTLDEQGNLVGGNEGFKMHVEGAKTPGLRRTALVIFAMLSMSGKPHEEAGGGY